jgi:molybdopterin-guanine dinucleotide biosynthesis protein A
MGRVGPLGGVYSAPLVASTAKVVVLAEMRVDELTGDDLRRLDSSDGILLMNVNSPDDLRHAERHERRHS